MSNGIFPELDPTAIFLSRVDHDEPLSSFSAFSFNLDGAEWPTVEHYFQAMKFENFDKQTKIRLAESPEQARKRGRRRFQGLRKDWKKIRVVIMTRALYTRCKTHPEIAQQLLDTGERTLIENNNYDYFWGCGRDRRGDNQYGTALMNVRNKLRSESKD